MLLDCDGVLGRGGNVLEGTVAALQRLRRQGITLRFVTNNSGKSREQYARVFQGLGIEVAAQEIVAASFMVAAYCQQHLAGSKILLLGNPGTEAELQQAGVHYVTPRDIEYCSSRAPWELSEFEACKLDPDISAVVVAFSGQFSYRHLSYASACLRENPGCALISSNPDASDSVRGGRRMPGTGCMVAAVEMASGMKAVTVGKGGPWLLPFLCKHFNLHPQEVCIVGDRLDTDIALGRAGGLRTILPLTGVTTLAEATSAAPADRPDFIVPDLAALAGIDTGTANVL